jgi:ribokinase
MVEAALDRLRPRSDDVVVVSHEVPTDAVLAALRAGRSAGATTILNPAPAIGVEMEAVGWADVVVPNEGELAELSGGLDAGPADRAPTSPSDVVDQAARLLASFEGAARGRSIIVTRGDRGAVLVRDVADPIDLPAPDVEAVDTTGAGDTFVGALAAGLAEGRDLEDAARRGVAAASLSTTKRGARGGMPNTQELDAFVVSR